MRALRLHYSWVLCYILLLMLLLMMAGAASSSHHQQHYISHQPSSAVLCCCSVAIPVPPPLHHEQQHHWLEALTLLGTQPWWPYHPLLHRIAKLKSKLLWPFNRLWVSLSSVLRIEGTRTWDICSDFVVDSAALPCNRPHASSTTMAFLTGYFHRRYLWCADFGFKYSGIPVSLLSIAAPCEKIYHRCLFFISRCDWTLPHSLWFGRSWPTTGFSSRVSFKFLLDVLLLWLQFVSIVQGLSEWHSCRKRLPNKGVSTRGHLPLTLRAFVAEMTSTLILLTVSLVEWGSITCCSTG